jgi:NADP-dependent 3-hydroxy acid dehydrogenase YdfG
MKSIIAVCGHGPGISDAVARRFGREGFAVALVARSADKLAKATESLEQEGITAQSFPADLGAPTAVRTVLREIRASLGPLTVLHWNAYSRGANDLTTAGPEELAAVFDVPVHGLLAGVQESLPDLRATRGAVLVTGGGLSSQDPRVDAMAVSWNAMGLALGKAAQHKAVGLLNARLSPEGVYVGQVVVMGAVKGTVFDRGGATIEAGAVADKFWELYGARSPGSVSFP